MEQRDRRGPVHPAKKFDVIPQAKVARQLLQGAAFHPIPREQKVVRGHPRLGERANEDVEALVGHEPPDPQDVGSGVGSTGQALQSPPG